MKTILKILKTLFFIIIILLILPYIINLPESKYKTGADIVSEFPQIYSGKFIDYEGKKIYVEDLNQNSNKVITFIHGFGGSSFTWRDNKQFFADNNYRVVLIDLPGFGLSSAKFENDYSHPAQAKAVKAVLDNLGIKKTDLVGHSMGANIATHLIQNYPEIFAKFIIVDGSIIENSNSNPLTSVLNFEPVRKLGDLALNTFYTKGNFTNTLKSAYGTDNTMTDNTINGYYMPLQINGWQDSLVGIIRDSNNNAIPKPLTELNIPTLIIWGSKDSWIPLEQGKSLQQKIKSSLFKEIQNTGHLSMEEKPLEFNNLVWEFIK
jgi:pimeloyl-ACP methyl ester carboxylesterase